MHTVIAVLSVLVAMTVIDGAWLGIVARSFYREHAGSLMAEAPNWTAAVLFYLVYTAGVTFFVVLPAADDGSILTGLWRGGLFGLVAYATYDLTNLATLRGWSTLISVVDLAWGVALTAAVGAIATFVVTRFA